MGAVVIGRNEGQRLTICLDSLLNRVEHIIYVDPGSSGNSLQEASERGVECMSLDISVSFTAARSRNEGPSFLFKNIQD
jgi:glycosyltransferase involved in cell wall biosynthesis